MIKDNADAIREYLAQAGYTEDLSHDFTGPGYSGGKESERYIWVSFEREKDHLRGSFAVRGEWLDLKVSIRRNLSEFCWPIKGHSPHMVANFVSDVLELLLRQPYYAEEAPK